MTTKRTRTRRSITWSLKRANMSVEQPLVVIFFFLFYFSLSCGHWNYSKSPLYFLPSENGCREENPRREGGTWEMAKKSASQPRGIYLTSFICKVSISTLSCSRSVVVCAFLALIPCLSVCRCICVWYSRLKGRGHYKPCKCICQPCGWVISKENISVKRTRAKRERLIEKEIER